MFFPDDENAALKANCRQHALKINLDEKVITNVIMCQAGEAKGHGFHLESDFMEQAAAYCSRLKDGIQSRFGHPGWDSDPIGTELGRFKNIRAENGKLIGDLYLYHAANQSPKLPGLADWILAMAQEDPKAFMCSIVFRSDYYYQYDEKGNKVKVYYYDSEGRWISPNTKMKIYIAFKSLEYCDLVDEGAVTDRLLSSLDPGVMVMLTANPDKANALLSPHVTKSQTISMKHKTVWTAILSVLGASKAETPVEEADIEQLNATLAQRNEQIVQLQARNQELTTSLSRIDELERQLAEARQAQDVTNSELTSLREALSASQQATEAATSQATALQSQVEALNTQVTSLKAENESLDNTITVMKGGVVKLGTDAHPDAVPGLVYTHK